MLPYESPLALMEKNPSCAGCMAAEGRAAADESSCIFEKGGYCITLKNLRSLSPGECLNMEVRGARTAAPA